VPPAQNLFRRGELAAVHHRQRRLDSPT
jgi:hypothetical protein